MGLKSYLARKGAKTRFIHIQDPQVDPVLFDLVVAMEHDKVRGDNVLVTRYALHDITPHSLAQSAAQFEPRFAKYERPRVAVLLGGSTNKYRFTEASMRQVIATLEGLLARTNASLLITTSRRTGSANTELLKSAFSGNKRVYIYDGEGENPYRGLLALADVIAVTDDSVNMMSEAQATGKPLYLLRLAGHADTKPARFAEALLDEGVARLPGEQLDHWSYRPSEEMPTLAAEIRRRLSLA
jgi:mitochondrial fission protein ELM1